MPYLAPFDAYLPCRGTPVDGPVGEGHESGAFATAPGSGADTLRESASTDLVRGWETMAGDWARGYPLGVHGAGRLSAVAFREGIGSDGA